MAGDEALLVGQSFLDSVNGIKFTIVGKGGTAPESLDVKVEFNVFTSTPNSPVNVAARAVSSSQINVSWDPSVGATSYNLRINGANVITGVTSLYQAKNLTANTTYTFEVQAVNASGASGWSSPVSTSTANIVPGIPTSFTVKPTSSTEINVFWTASPASENVTSYNLRRDGSQVFTGLTGTNYFINTLTPNTTYTFEVQAVNSNGPSDWSAPASVTTAPAIPVTPTNVAAQVASSSQINVSWDPSVGTASYNLRINGSNVITGVTSPYQAKNLTANTTYTFEVQAVNASGASGWSTPVSATTTSGLPSVPTNIAAQVASSSQINISWDPSVGATSYNLRINGANVITAVTNPYQAKNLTTNTTYTFEVQAVNVNGASG